MKRELTFLLIGTLLTTSACKKNFQSSDSKFNSDAAKEWYYGSFKKSAEYVGYNSKLHGKKSPDWNNGVYKKIGNMEIVEFPLIKVKSFVSVPSTSSGPTSQDKRIADASLSRIVFFKTSSNNILIREVEFIPDWIYLQKKEFDISDNSITQLDSEFSGRLVIKKWNGDILSASVISNGKLIGKVREKKPIAVTNTSFERRGSANTALECTDYIIIEYEQWCTEWWVGDQLVREECGSWQQTGNQWIETVCYQDQQCSPNLSSEECACQLYGICEGGGGDGGSEEENCNLPDINTVFDNSGTVSLDIESITDPEFATSQGDIKRNWRSRWYFYRGKLLNYSWSYISLERGVHKKYGNVWKWESITHVGEQTEGTTPFQTTITMNDPHGSISADKLKATMELDFQIEMCFLCKGLPFGCKTKTENVSRDFYCN